MSFHPSVWIALMAAQTVGWEASHVTILPHLLVFQAACSSPGGDKDKGVRGKWTPYRKSSSRQVGRCCATWPKTKTRIAALLPTSRLPLSPTSLPLLSLLWNIHFFFSLSYFLNPGEDCKFSKLSIPNCLRLLAGSRTLKRLPGRQGVLPNTEIFHSTWCLLFRVNHFWWDFSGCSSSFLLRFFFLLPRRDKKNCSEIE